MADTAHRPIQSAETDQDLALKHNVPVHARAAEEVLQTLEVDPEQGLSSAVIRNRRQQFGPNQLRKAQRRSIWRILLDQFKSVVLLVLGVAGIVSLALGEWAEAVAILAVLVINALIGFVSEWRAMRSMAALQQLGQDRIRVRRAGREQDLAASELVPGDIVLLEGGDIGPADIRLFEANNLQADEAALTGESVPVNKSIDAVATDAPLAEHTNMLFKGATLTQGSGSGVVVATGIHTELGRIAKLTQQAGSQSTPLEQRLDALGRRLAWITLGVAAVVALFGLLAGQPVQLMIETAIALGVAAIPEGLPIVATIALARGMWLMAQRNALINRLAAVETLGATRVILTDKTGTLTQNRMQLVKVRTPSDEFDLTETETPDRQTADQTNPLLRRVLEVVVLCNNAILQDEQNDELGDPMEVAMLRAGASFGLKRQELLAEYPEIREVSFDTEVMMMATYHETQEGIRVAVKGAPRAVLEACDRLAATQDELDQAGRRAWLEHSENLASEGLRVLAVADKTVDNAAAEPYQGLCLLGLVGLLDPPRASVKDAVRACRSAGIRVVMVTGDQAATAQAIACQVGLIETADVPVYDGRDLEDLADLPSERHSALRQAAVFARVSPEQKLGLVNLYQEAGEIVAMTGDGINDAPALKQADIGVAMGQQGTDAAREAADMVLQDDRFETIVAAVQQGRVIFANIRKSVLFMLCTNVAEIIAVTAAAVVGAPLPLHPLQILYLNVITDVFPALALGVGAGDERVLQRPPRDPQERVLTRRHWLAIGGWGLFIAACVLSALALALLGLGLSETAAVTVSFLTLGMTKLWFVFNLRDRDSTLWRNAVVRNPYIWGALALCLGLLLLAVYWPGLAALLDTQSPGWSGWGLIVAMSLLPLLAGQIWLMLSAKPKSQQGN